jgi:formamidopyrimidine-DNA glycosylase
MVAKKAAKMGHNKDKSDTGHKPGIPCGHCGGLMEWAKVGGKMKWFCPACGLSCGV